MDLPVSCKAHPHHHRIQCRLKLLPMTTIHLFLPTWSPRSFPDGLETELDFFLTNSFEKMVLPRFSRSLDWLLIIEFCYFRVSGFELICCWIVNRRTALSTTYFACLLVVCRERRRRSPKLLSSCSGMIDFKQNIL